MEPKLPKEFLLNMQELLQEEYQAYIESFQMERLYGLRVNTLKISVEEFLKIAPFELKPIPWIPNGFYYQGNEKPAKHPYYFAGLYYLQEPSAMTPASRLPIDAGDRVLDVCAAPGGKTTELGAKLQSTGLLVTNDISNSRAKALLKNVELFGINNAIVVSEAPYKLEQRFSNFFDKILIDAPCSGEGMFRKDQAVARAWAEKDDPNGLYAKLQREILTSAVAMLKMGGMIVYSTCTFSERENEETIQWLLETYPEFHILPMEGYEGFSGGTPRFVEQNQDFANCVRIWPQRMSGEGHFVTLLVKGEPKEPIPYTKQISETYAKGISEEFQKFYDEYLLTDRFTKGGFFAHNDQIHYMNMEEMLQLKGLRVMRNGLLVGESLKNRFEPSQAFAMALKMEEFRYALSLPVSDERVIRYLKGETITLTEEEQKAFKNGAWVLVGVDNYPLGFAKYVGGNLKNKYLPGWRWQ